LQIVAPKRSEDRPDRCHDGRAVPEGNVTFTLIDFAVPRVSSVVRPSFMIASALTGATTPPLGLP